MWLVFLSVINSRGCTEGQKPFLEVIRTSPSDKIKLMWLLVLISKAAGCCSVFGMVVVALRDYAKLDMNSLMRKCWIFLQAV